MIRIEALTTDQTGTELANVRVTVEGTDIALLPKMLKLKTCKSYKGDGTEIGIAYIDFRTNGVNGGTNEAGVKRVKAMLKAADKHNIGIVFAQPSFIKDELNICMWDGGMRYITRSELETLIG